MHDFCFTEDYYVFLQNPVSMDFSAFLLGLKCPGETMQFDPTKPTKAYLVPRR